jgi:hypothetical protein
LRTLGRGSRLPQVLKFFSTREAEENAEVERRAQFDAFKKYLDQFKRELLELIRVLPIAKLADEPLAPWVCYLYPLKFDHAQMDSLGIEPLTYYEKASFYWHTLEAAHCTRAFLQHFSALTLEAKVDYFRRYDLGPKWIDREPWFQLAFDENTNVSDDDYERAYAQVFSEKRDAARATRTPPR